MIEVSNVGVEKMSNIYVQLIKIAQKLDVLCIFFPFLNIIIDTSTKLTKSLNYLLQIKGEIGISDYVCLQYHVHTDTACKMFENEGLVGQLIF